MNTIAALLHFSTTIKQFQLPRKCLEHLVVKVPISYIILLTVIICKITSLAISVMHIKSFRVVRRAYSQYSAMVIATQAYILLNTMLYKCTYFVDYIAFALHKTRGTTLQVFEKVLQSISGNKHLHLQF